MSKLPSLQKILHGIKRTILRFPLETLTAITGTVFAILLVEKKYDDPKEFCIKAIMACSLCLVSFLSVSLYFEAAKKSQLYRYATSIVLVGLITIFVFSFSTDITPVEVMQFVTLNIALHLLVSFAGFIPKAYNQDEFWEFNKQLFLKILTAGLYSGVLYCGLALAILAVKELFFFKMPSDIYGYVFVSIAGIFNTIFFLSGVPETNNAQAPLVLNYPKGLKNFTQFVLLPLISIYLVILLCYEAQIIVFTELPVGWVSYLVLVFAVFGILSFLLIHPIANENGNLWIRTYNRLFYFLLIPLLGLLYWAILYRISLYGFTHERYYVLLLSIWLLIVVAYFLILKQPKIKFIPISLCIAGLFSIYGPQSANSISKYSQLSRFETYIQKSEKQKLSFEEVKDLSSIVLFLKNNYEVEVMVPYAKAKLEKLLKKDKAPDVYAIVGALGYDYKSYYDQEGDDTNFYYYYYGDYQLENIHGYDIAFVLNNNEDFQCDNCTKIENKNYSIAAFRKNGIIELKINQDMVILNISEFVNQNPEFKVHSNSDKKIIQKVETPKYRISLDYMSLNGRFKNNKKIVQNYQIKIMVGIKE